MFIKFLQSSLFSSLHCLSLTPLELEVCASTWRCSRCLCQEHSSLSGSLCHIHRQWCFKLNTCATKETTEHVGTEQSDPNATFYTDAAANKCKDAFGSCVPTLIWLSTLTLSAPSPGSSRHKCDFLKKFFCWPVDLRRLWESCIEETGTADWLFSL